MDVPVRFLPTQTVAPETFVVRQLVGEGLAPNLAMLNTMVIRGAEPVIVDTGAALTRSEWLDHTFALVEPEDVRWIFLSHDDTDHTGNLHQVLDRAPNATLVTNWFTIERTAADGPMLPLERLRILNPGESFTAGDRTLTAVVPPTFDSPTTRGLFDSTSRVYWAADSFGTAVPTETDDIAELDPGFFRETFLQTQKMLSPWHRWLDPVKYDRLLQGIRDLDANVVVGAHGPALHGRQINSALLLMEELPYLQAADLVGQADLEVLLQLLGVMPAGEAMPAAS
jgi:flavorubredoxin